MRANNMTIVDKEAISRFRKLEAEKENLERLVVEQKTAINKINAVAVHLGGEACFVINEILALTPLTMTQMREAEKNVVELAKNLVFTDFSRSFKDELGFKVEGIKALSEACQHLYDLQHGVVRKESKDGG